MEIDGKTRITGLFGFPVSHTLSPAMHNAAFDHLGLNYRYLPFSVSPDKLSAAVESVRALAMAGVNVTVPHKEAVIPLLDSVDEEAAFIGAVNTVVNRDGRLKGFNTDGRGFIKSLEEQSVAINKRKIMIVGSGGAARAIGHYLGAEASLLHLYDIDSRKRERLAADLSGRMAEVRPAASLDAIGEFDILVNATPLGLSEGDPLPFDVGRLGPSQTVCDLIYRETPLLKEASRRGCTSVNGLGMLLWQGVLAFELWTGIVPPVEVMKKALLSKIAP